MKQLRVAFIGAGGIAARHIQALQEINEVEIAAIYNPSPEKAQALAAKCSPATKAYQNYAKMLDKEILDALYICTPPFGHGELELAAIERNIPLFVEKPLSADAETAEKIFEAIQAKGLITAVGYQWRYLNTTELVQSLLATNPPRMALGYWLDALPSPYWWKVENLSGGQMVEQTTHIFDLARLLVGEIKRVYALGGRFSADQAEVDRVTTATVEFANGAIGTFSSTSLLHGLYRRGLEFFCEGRTIALAYQEVTIDEGPGQQRVEKVTVDPFVLENRDFLEALRGGENRIRCDYAEALKTHRVTQAARRSALEKRPVDL